MSAADGTPTFDGAIDELVLENASWVAELPASDPLRTLLAAQVAAGCILPAASHDDEARAIIDAMRSAPVSDLESRLLSIPNSEAPATGAPGGDAERGRGASRSLIGGGMVLVLAAAAAVALWALPRGPSVLPLPDAQRAAATAVPSGKAAVPTAAVPTAKAAAPTASPKLIAIKMYHAQCPNCRKLEVDYPQVQREYEKGSTLFVTFDCTDDQTREQSRLLASALSLNSIYQEHLNTTGIVLLVDPTTQKVLGRLTSQQSGEEMRQAMERAHRVVMR